MEGFSKIDIFDTKGIEYIFVIGYLLLLIIVWHVSSRQVKLKKQVQKALGSFSAQVLRIPQGLFYSRNHTWTHLEKSGEAKVGIDDLLQHITGEVSFCNLRNPGEFIKKGDLLTEITQDNRDLRILSPISGMIVDVNYDLAESPELINADPYGKGWICKIKPSSWSAETNVCLMAEAATKWTEKEVERFRDFLAVSMKKLTSEPAMVILQDGGELRDHTLTQLPEEVWKDFQENFLDKVG